MALLRSMLTGISGLRSQQAAIDVTGDNIANVSNIGFKGSRVNFSTLISQSLRFGQAPSGFLGGTNPSQVGLGTQVATIQQLFTQGQLKPTGIATDLAIDDGANARTFFVLRDYKGSNVYTRDGTFSLNRESELYDSGTGYKVRGWMADPNSQIVQPDGSIDFELNSGAGLEDISIEIGNLVIANETTYTDWRGNLNGEGEIADNASVLESESLFDASSGTLVAASESTLLVNLSRSSTGDAQGSPVDLGLEIGSVISIEATVGGSSVRRDFLVGDPPPTGGLTLGDLRDWMQGALGIDRSSAAGEEMISAQRLNAVTGEVVNGTLDQIGATGFTSLTLGGADYQTFSGSNGLANQTNVNFTLDLTDVNSNALITTAAVNVNGTGAAGVVTSADVEAALNSAATTAGLTTQFTVTGSFSAGFSVLNREGNIFTLSGGTLTTMLGAGNDPAVSTGDSTLGVSQQPLLNVGNTITFDNFTPLMAAQTMSAVASGVGNGANQFEIGATAAETASNLATAINMNAGISGLVTASVVGNQIQFQAKRAGVDGDFEITIDPTASTNAVIRSTTGVETMNAAAGDTMAISTDGNAVTSVLNGRVDLTSFPSVLPNGLTGSAADTTVEILMTVENLANSPITLSIDDSVAYATPTDFVNAVIAAIDADTNIINAGLNGTFAATTDDTTGVFSITSSANANFSISSDPSDADDFARVFQSSASSTSNGVQIQLVPQGGAANVGYTAVEVGATPSITNQAVAAAINSSVYTNPPIAATALGSFLRLTDESSISSGQGNANGGIIQAITTGFTQPTAATSLIGAGASADLFIEPDPIDFANNAAIGTIIDDEMDFTSAGVQVGDFIRFSTGPASGLIGKITHVGMREDPAIAGNLISNPHALRFELQSSDTLPFSSVPSAYTIHEAAAVDIGVNSNLSRANPPLGLDTASDSGKLRVSGHVGDSNRIGGITLKVSNPSGTQNVLANFNTINEANGESASTSIVVYDSLGIDRQVDLTFWLESKSNGGTRWRWQATAEDNNVTPGTKVQTVVGNGTIDFDTLGRYLSDSGSQIRIDLDDFGVSEPVVANLNFSQLTGFAADMAPDGSVTNPTEVFLFNQDGFKAGTLEDFSIGTDGRISGFFNNGLTRTLGQVATARFANPEGLVHEGDNYFREDVNSGLALIGTPGSAGRGIIRSGFLEESNVELAEQFTNLIQSQRAFQANARTISVSSQLLQELVNLV